MSALTQNTPEWEQARKDKVGASDAPIIMEVSPYKTPYQLWQEKLSLIEPRQNFAMARGHYLEPKALELVEQKTGLLLRPMVKFHAELTWMMASLDAIDVEEKTIVEIKSPGKEDHNQAVSGQIPQKYFPQLQHQMEVCQVDHAFYFSFDGVDGVLLKIERDDKYIKNLISKEKEFWECIQELTAPALLDRDYQPKSDEQWLNAACEWIAIQKQMESLQQKEESLRGQLISLSQNQNSAGGGVRVSKLTRKGNVDYKKIPELKVVNLDDYRKDPVEYWKIVSAK